MTNSEIDLQNKYADKQSYLRKVHLIASCSQSDIQSGFSTLGFIAASRQRSWLRKIKLRNATELYDSVHNVYFAQSHFVHCACRPTGRTLCYIRPHIMHFVNSSIRPHIELHQAACGLKKGVCGTLI